jgi:hypothetical protein
VYSYYCTRVLYVRVYSYLYKFIVQVRSAFLSRVSRISPRWHFKLVHLTLNYSIESSRAKSSRVESSRVSRKPGKSCHEKRDSIIFLGHDQSKQPPSNIIVMVTGPFNHCPEVNYAPLSILILTPILSLSSSFTTTVRVES